MSIKDVLVYVDNDKACANRLRAAGNLCSTYGAYLSGVYAPRKVIIPAYACAYVPPHVFDATDKETAKLLENARTVFSRQLAASNIKGDLYTEENNINVAVNVYSRYVDLLICPQRITDRDDLNYRFDLPTILLGAACPVLMLPHNISTVLPFHRVMLGWDGSRESARVLHAALPLLAQVEQLDIVTIGDKDVEAKDIALHTARHGIKTEVHLFSCSRFETERVLLEKSHSLKSDLLLMGAYGHSRLRELVLGGATNYALEHAEIPVLFAH